MLRCGACGLSPPLGCGTCSKARRGTEKHVSQTAREVGAGFLASSSLSSCLDSTSNTATFPSIEPQATRLPDGLNATL